MPRDIKEVVNQMRASVQSALQARVSRIDVDLPIGAEFGVEQGGETRKRGAKLTSADVARSDREVARLFVEMFEGTGLRLRLAAGLTTRGRVLELRAADPLRNHRFGCF